MFDYGKAVCYSGYREGQSPIRHVYPTYEEISEDLLILDKYFDYIRLYDGSQHAQTVLKVIKDHNLKLKVMLGVEPGGEISNPNCPWGGLHTEEEIEFNKVNNYKKLDHIAALANEFKDQVLAVSVGNECTSDWHPGLMDPLTVAKHVKYVKSLISHPVTFCEGAYYWMTKGKPIAEEVDFISIHSYPLWQKVNIDKALQMNIKDFEDNLRTYPNKDIIFTEFGWATMSNEQMDSTQTNEENQKEYLNQVEKWAEENKITMFIFEAFDEPWKGSTNPIEPEKHWGILNVNRSPKKWFSSKLKK
ncbi:MAG: glycosyl hydrolase [Firmicutes bacterium]|nr:glycosyl hydrolase [Bacillota bacterium]